MNSLVCLVVLVLAIVLLGVSAWRLSLYNALNQIMKNRLPKGVNLNQTFELSAKISEHCIQQNEGDECIQKKINNGLILWGTLVGISSIVLLFCVIKLGINFQNQKKLKN
jgi:hypothetical protein